MRPIPVVTPTQRAAIEQLLQGALELAERSMNDPMASDNIRDNNRQIRTIILSCMLVLNSGSKWSADFSSVMLNIFKEAILAVIRGDFSYDEFITRIKETVLHLGNISDPDQLDQLIQNLIDLF